MNNNQLKVIYVNFGAAKLQSFILCKLHEATYIVVLSYSSGWTFKPKQKGHQIHVKLIFISKILMLLVLYTFHRPNQEHNPR